VTPPGKPVRLQNLKISNSKEVNMKRNTACACDSEGWCSRHKMNKTGALFRLCKFSEAHFNQWEQGIGPGQLLAEKFGLPSNNGDGRACSPKVAICIISHNYGAFLEECIESVLNQSVPAAEIIVVDDASTDDTEKIAASYADAGVNYLRVDFQNVHKTRQAGFEATSAPIICFLDADDILSPDYLDQGLVPFTDDRIAIVYSDCQLFGERDAYLNYPTVYDAGQLERDNFIHAGSLVRRDAIILSRVFEKAFDPIYVQGDWFLWRHILRDGWIAAKQKSVYHYRKHTANWTQLMLKHQPSYYQYAALDQEVVTLCIPLAGRMELWPELAAFLERQMWPHHQLRLLFIDTSQNPEFSAVVRNWVAQSDYPTVSYIQQSVGTPRLADDNRRREEIQNSVRQAMARIYNRLAREVTTEYVWILEDDILPPDDVCQQLLLAFDAKTASVAAPYRSRFHKGYCAWNEDFHCIHEPGEGVQTIAGNGFGCTIVRGSLLRESVFTSRSDPPDFDLAFYHRLKQTDLQARIDWSCECEHREQGGKTNRGRWSTLIKGTQRPFGDEVTYHRAAQFLADCEQIEDWGCGFGWFSKILAGHSDAHVQNLDGTKTEFSDRQVNLCNYRSQSEGILLRHVLEHNHGWRQVLENALHSFQRKLVIVIYTPFTKETHNRNDHEFEDGTTVPVISFRLEDLQDCFARHPEISVSEERLQTRTEFRDEQIFYLEKINTAITTSIS